MRYQTMKKTEAFASGSAATVIQKAMNVLGRRIGSPITVSPLGLDFQNADGKFTAYMALFDKGTRAFRICFRLGKSDEIYSVDYFGEISVKPTYRVLLQGLNIVQILNTLEDLALGNHSELTMEENVKALEKAGIKEATGVGAIEAWLAADQRAASKARTERVSVLFNDYFSRWAPQNGVSMGYGAFSVNFKRYCVAKNIQNPNLRLGVVAAPIPETPIEDPAAEQIFQGEIIENEHLEKFEMMESFLRQIARNSKRINALFIYGIGGIGKSFITKKIMEEEGAMDRVVIKKGNIAGYTGLLQLLYDNREGKIIILDDNDSILQNQTSANILKAALDTDNPRHISVTKKDRAETASTKPRKIAYYGGAKPIDLNEVTANDMVDFTSDSGIDDPDAMYDFDFLSKMIFISNLTKVPQAVGDRCVGIELNFTKEQILDLIGMRLDGIFPDDPDITREDKIVVLEFMKAEAAMAKKISFRQFQFALSTYVGDNRGSKWQNWVRIMLRSGQDSFAGRNR